MPTKLQKEGREFVCDLCEKRFTRRNSLSRHIVEVHQKKKSLLCTTCNSTFARKSDLMRHISSIHHGERPFLCEFCSSTFSQKGNRNKHVRQIHTSIKPIYGQQEEGLNIAEDEEDDDERMISDAQKVYGEQPSRKGDNVCATFDQYTITEDQSSEDVDQQQWLEFIRIMTDENVVLLDWDKTEEQQKALLEGRELYVLPKFPDKPDQL